MSQLNLKPDPIILGVQALLFFANIGIVKKLILDPYLRLKDARSKATVGGQSEAEHLLTQSKQMQEQIDRRMRETFQQASNAAESIRSTATSKKNALISEAEGQARDAQNKALQDIDAEVKSARVTLEKEVDQIAAKMMDAVLA